MFRKVAVCIVVIPYALVVWPQWIVRDFAVAFKQGYNASKQAREERNAQKGK